MEMLSEIVVIYVYPRCLIKGKIYQQANKYFYASEELRGYYSAMIVVQ